MFIYEDKIKEASKGRVKETLKETTPLCSKVKNHIVRYSCKKDYYHTRNIFKRGKSSKVGIL